MANLSQIRREQMLSFLETLKEQHSDDESLIAINQIERELTAKKYGLVWEEHEEEVDEKMKTHIPVFTEDVSKEIVGNPDSDDFNFLLEGDNLHSLKLLEKTHKGRISAIYIDPPYNTGASDFTYDDKIVDTLDGFRHSKWLSFMRHRLQIAKNLLSDEGYIYISIDDNEQAQLKLLCDEIFGEDNFLNQICINMNSLSGVKMTHAINGKRYPAQKEYLLIYKKKNNRKLLIEKNHKEKWDKEYNLIIPELNKEQFLDFDGMLDEEVNERLAKMHLYTLAQFSQDNNIKIDDNWLWSNAYRIFGSKSNRPLAKRLKDCEFGQQIVCYTNNDGNKRFFRSDYNKDAKDPRIELVQAEANSTVFLSDNWIDISNDGGVAQEGGIPFPNGKKPLALIKRILRSLNDNNALILDFFAGSGTTGHAVLELNEEDGGNRKFILCTNNENNICENITYTRLSNAINGYGMHSPLLSNMKYYKTEFVEKNSENLYDDLLEHIVEMIQLQFGVKVDNEKYVIIMDDEEMDEFEKNIANYDKLEAVFINQDVLLSTSQEKMLEKVNTYIIPDCYFDFELREAGELW